MVDFCGSGIGGGCEVRCFVDGQLTGVFVTGESEFIAMLKDVVYAPDLGYNEFCS